MKRRKFSNLFLNSRRIAAWGSALLLPLAVLGGCRTPQPEIELQQENQALEQRIHENYAFMQHQQRRISELETKLSQNDGNLPETTANASNSESATPVNVSAVSKPTTSATASGASANGPRWKNPETGEPAPSANPGTASAASEGRGSLLDGIQADPTGQPTVIIPEGAKPSANVPKGLFDRSAAPGASQPDSTVPGGAAQPNNGSSGNNNQTALPIEISPTAQLRQASPEEIAQISIDPTQIGPLQIDFDRQREGLRFVLNCQTQQGETVTTASPAEIVVIDPLQPGDAARVARWNVASEQMQDRIQLTPQPDGVLFELAWPQNRKPQNSPLDVFVRLTDKTGRKIQAHQQVNLTAPQFSLWQNTAPQPMFANTAVSQPAPDLPQNNPETAGEQTLNNNLGDSREQAGSEELPAAQTLISKSEITVAAPQIDGLRESYQTKLAQTQAQSDVRTSAPTHLGQPIPSSPNETTPNTGNRYASDQAAPHQSVRKTANQTANLNGSGQESGYVQPVQALVPINSPSSRQNAPRSTSGIPAWSPYR